MKAVSNKAVDAEVSGVDPSEAKTVKTKSIGTDTAASERAVRKRLPLKGLCRKSGLCSRTDPGQALSPAVFRRQIALDFLRGL